MNIYFYLKEEKIYHLKEDRQEEILIDNLEKFIKENRNNVFIIIISKLNIYFKKVEFEFKNKKKIKMILNQELEGKLPKSIDNFYFYREFNYSGKNKTTVNIFAVEKEKLDTLRKIFESNRIKFKFTIDSIILYQFFKEKTNDRNLIELFVENDYFILNLIENSTISNIYSYSSKNIKDSISELFNLILPSKKFPVYFIGRKEIHEEIKLEKMKFFGEKSFFSILREIKKMPFVNFSQLSTPKKIFSFEYLFYIIFLIAISFLFINPYLEKEKREKKIKEINEKMENIYKSIFPETTKIVNPLIQIKEKINKNSLKVPISDISLIKILEEITIFFPENIKVEIEELIFTGHNVTLFGKIDNLKNLDKVKENVKKSKIFTGFEITSVSFTKEGNVKFGLLLKM
ncbi:MAG: hypothetical protein NC915_02075 [Candidatus Omnitrophica bacterium]|nr:hypothetical protein [Candidatus Omnitrophota bacterium]